MEYSKYRDGSRAKEAEATPPKKRTENSTTIGICATPVDSTYHTGTQVKPAHKNVAEQATRRIVTGETTRATCKQDTASGSRRKMRISYPPTPDHTKLDG
jgi:hypothetical protein